MVAIGVNMLAGWAERQGQGDAEILSHQECMEKKMSEAWRRWGQSTMGTDWISQVGVLVIG